MKFSRRLIDIGAEVNLITVKDAINNGSFNDMGGIQMIKGFNDGSSPVDGIMECEILLGPCGDAKKVEFQVTPIATIPIIGCPTLSELGMRLDFQERIIFVVQRNVVRCPVVHCLKN